jgi:hypothetical protein
MLKRVNLKDWISIVVLLFALILSIDALNAPWWTVKTPVSNQIKTNITDSAYYNPSQTISANHVELSPNNTLSIIVPFAELATNQSDIGQLNSLFNITYYVAIPGVVLILLTLLLMLFSILRKPVFALPWIFPLIATILLLAAPIYLLTQMPPIISKLPTVIPPQVAIASGADMSGFWGSSQEWTWGAGVGWTMMIVSAYLSAASMILIRATTKKQNAIKLL